MKKRKLKPMGLKRLNMMLKDVDSNYRVEKVGNEIIMAKKEGIKNER